MFRFAVIGVGLFLLGMTVRGHCKSISGVPGSSTKEVVVSAGEIQQWKEDVHRSFLSMGLNPFDAMANMFLQSTGVSEIPQGTKTIKTPLEVKQRLGRIKKGIQAAVGFMVVNQYEVLSSNTDAINAAIESASATIQDATQRQMFIRRAREIREKIKHP